MQNKYKLLWIFATIIDFSHLNFEGKKTMEPTTFKTLKDFYPYYLQEHKHTMTRVMHFTGTLGVIGIVIYAIFSAKFLCLLLIPIIGYGFAWFSHMIFERNKPATFRYPFFSLASDFILFWHLLSGKEKF